MDNLIRMVRTHEGMRLKPYVCTAGRVTIGVGRNLQDTGITEEEALYLLRNDITRVRNELEANLSFWHDLPVARKEALIDMCFNLGLSRFLGFRKMIVALEVGNYEEAGREMLESRWAVQVGQRAKELATMVRKGRAL